MKYLAILLIIFIQFPKTIAQPYPERCITEISDGVIFHKDYINRGYPYKWIKRERFTPNMIDINVFEKQLNQNINSLLQKHNKSHKYNQVDKFPLYEFKRQYFGYFENSKKILLVYFICNETIQDLEWTVKHTSVEGGGECYWRISFNLNNQQFEGLSFNAYK